MDDRTGQIREFDSSADALLNGFNVRLPHKPVATCQRCGGTGSRKSGVTGRFVPCRSCYGVKQELPTLREMAKRLG